MASRGTSARFHVVLLAGGSGTRFWPMSRENRPKQFLALAEGEPLLVATWKRVRRLAPPRRIWVVAPGFLVDDIRRMLPSLLEGNLVVEPCPRDTAPAIGLACARVASRDPGATVGVFPTDHAIRDTEAFQKSVLAAAEAASKGALVCLGVRPDRPATGFGYLRCARPPRRIVAVPVERFEEKPGEARARRYVRSGRYLWNAGMFVWKAERFLEELGRTAPVILRAVRSVLAGRKRSWERVEKISVDHAVMEKADDVQVVPLEAGWDDVGSWDAAARLRERSGRTAGRHLLMDSENSVVFGEHRFVVLLGVKGLVLVDTPDALLVASRDRSEQVRDVVEALHRSNKKELL